ncbi:hypothetical protein BX600DRAFT_165003 [Xylariales sp. PMI_506]|nr:hypothetical protein BX600DRAFT_165003 [Xylariales sp. PMI_506]
MKDVSFHPAFHTPRYRYCLFVDDLCIESVTFQDMNNYWPVVKLLNKEWGPLPVSERTCNIYPGFEDGETEYDEEDVDWMYMNIGSDPFNEKPIYGEIS